MISFFWGVVYCRSVFYNMLLNIYKLNKKSIAIQILASIFA
nr:MAG TPA: hypothetical protein [Caudoviricetes sp.]